MAYNWPMSTRRVALFLASVVIVAGLAVAYRLATPRLLSFYPGEGDRDIPGTVSLRLDFSRSMQNEDILERLSINPAIEGAFAWEGNTLIFTPGQAWPAGETITASLASGARAKGFPRLAITRGMSWSFAIGQPRLLYLWPAGEVANLYTLNLATGQSEQLSNSQSGWLDFSISWSGGYQAGIDKPGNEDGNQEEGSAGGDVGQGNPTPDTEIYFSERNASGGSDLFRIGLGELEAGGRAQRLLSCLQALCRSPQPAPDGSLLAFERSPLPGSGQSLFPQVWLLRLGGEGEIDQQSEHEFPAGDPGHPGRLPAWSASGVLAYYDVTRKGFSLLDPLSGETAFFANETGEAGAWSPDGEVFVAPEILSPARAGTGAAGSGPEASQLFAFELLSGTSRNLSLEASSEDTSPAFSPDGAQVAFARKFLDAERWTPGRQIWLMNADGSQARQLTSDPQFHHSAFAWSPDGGMLAYLRFNQDQPGDPVELWWMDVNTGERNLIIPGGYAPLWIP
jgi:hypothetical protein